MVFPRPGPRRIDVWASLGKDLPRRPPFHARRSPWRQQPPADLTLRANLALFRAPQAGQGSGRALAARGSGPRLGPDPVEVGGVAVEDRERDHARHVVGMQL